MTEIRNRCKKCGRFMTPIEWPDNLAYRCMHCNPEFVIPIEAAPIIDRDDTVLTWRKCEFCSQSLDGLKPTLDCMQCGKWGVLSVEKKTPNDEAIPNIKMGRKCDHCQQPMIRNESEKTWDCLHCGGWEGFGIDEKMPSVDGFIDATAIEDDIDMLRLTALCCSLRETQVALRALQLKMNAVKAVLQIIAYDHERPFNPRDLAKVALEELEK